MMGEAPPSHEPQGILLSGSYCYHLHVILVYSFKNDLKHNSVKSELCSIFSLFYLKITKTNLC